MPALSGSYRFQRRTDQSYGRRTACKAFWLELLDQLPEGFRGKLQACLKSDEASSSAIKAFVAGSGSLDGATVRRELTCGCNILSRGYSGYL